MLKNSSPDKFTYKKVYSTVTKLCPKRLKGGWKKKNIITEENCLLKNKRTSFFKRTLILNFNFISNDTGIADNVTYMEFKLDGISSCGVLRSGVLCDRSISTKLN